MEIKLDAEAAASIASAAIFDSLSEEARDSVIKQAIEHLLTPNKERHTFGAGKTPLQMAFDQALTQAAYKAVQERVADDPDVKAKIDELLTPLLTNALAAEAENYDHSLADKLGSALGQWLSDKAREGATR